MTAQEIRNDYKTDSIGRIKDPGKFEGQPIFAPFYWNMGLDGCADSDDGKVFAFKFKSDSADLETWPELKQWLGRSRTLKLYEDGCGFVHCS